MKNLYFIILLLSTISASCQKTREMRLDYVKIAPIGISDIPRDTLYVSLKKIDGTANTISTKYIRLVYQIITDVKTLSEMALFIRKNDNKNPIQKDFNEYGCFEISGYKKDSLIISYRLNRLDSKEYLNALIKTLVNNNRDIVVIKALKEQCLEPIDY